MPRATKIALAILLVGVVGGALYLRSLQERVLDLGKTKRAEEQSRRELEEPQIATATDQRVTTRIYRAGDQPGALVAVTVELPLSEDPVQRAKQLLRVLLSLPADEHQRTLPEEARLIEFYLLPDGTAVADFSQALATDTASGIGSEQLAVESIVRTMDANVPGIKRLKILVNGQETEALAGHVDLSGFFEMGRSEGSSGGR